jgi:hypothetical protein
MAFQGGTYRLVYFGDSKPFIGSSLRFQGLRLASEFLKQSQNDPNVIVVRRRMQQSISITH